MPSAGHGKTVAYGRAFFEGQAPHSLRTARRVVPEVISLLSPSSVIDVGSGVGTWLSVFRDCGVTDVLGVDGAYVETESLLIPADCFLARDLTAPIGLDRRFDLAMSLEVAEHLPPEVAVSFVGQLVDLSDIVLFSAAIPGQGGRNHINERWQSDWCSLFSAREYVPVDCLRHRFWKDPEVSAYYRQNMILYVQQEVLVHNPKLQAEANHAALIPLDLAHPLVVESMLTRQPNLKTLLRALPGSIRQSLLWHLGLR